MKTINSKILPIAMLVLTTAILLGGSVGMAALAVKHKDVQTINNAKQIIVKSGTQTYVVNVNGAPGATGATGPAGSNGKAGMNGTNGINGKDGANGTAGVAGPVGPVGPIGPRGNNGTTSIIVCQSNSTNPACNNPTPTPVPVTNGTGNVTKPPVPVTNGTGNATHTSLHIHAQHK